LCKALASHQEAGCEYDLINFQSVVPPIRLWL
jgi:hypothetical protein